jgi:hypothetical protein
MGSVSDANQRASTKTTENRDASGTQSLDKTFASEEELRLDAHKWETSLKATRTFVAASLTDPEFDVHYNARLGGAQSSQGKAISYALVVAVHSEHIRDPASHPDVLKFGKPECRMTGKLGAEARSSSGGHPSQFGKQTFQSLADSVRGFPRGRTAFAISIIFFQFELDKKIHFIETQHSSRKALMQKVAQPDELLARVVGNEVGQGLFAAFSLD